MVGFEDVAVQLLNGISVGLSISLLAIGLTLIFGVLDIVNFAHGEFYMMGGYGILVLQPTVGNYWLAVVLSTVAVVVISLVLYRLTLKPIRDRDPLDSLIVTFGMLLILQQLADEIFGGQPRRLAGPVSGSVQLGPITYPSMRLLAIVGTIVVLLGVWVFLNRTRFGIHLRAAAQNIEAARSLGVDADHIFRSTFAISALLAVVAATFLAPSRTISPTVGNTVILDAFIVVIVGGLGSVTGAVVAALAIGLIKSLSILWLPAFTGNILSFLLLIGILLWRPEGLFVAGGSR